MVLNIVFNKNLIKIVKAEKSFIKGAITRLKGARTRLNHLQSVFPDITMQESDYTASLIEGTGDSEDDGLCIMALQLVLQNHHIIFERQCRDYLPGGEFGDLKADQEAVRNCPLTNRACESVVATLDESHKGHNKVSLDFKNIQKKQEDL